MSTELWFRNPRNYIRELSGTGVSNFAWDRGILVKHGVDPGQFAELWLRGRPWRALVIGDQGSDYIDTDHPDIDRPLYRFATWEYGLHKPDQLHEWAQFNPDPDQPHTLVVTRPPDTRTIAGRNFLYDLAEVQRDNPQCMIHVHGLYNFKFLFGVGFRSVDYEPRTEAAHGQIKLPNGRRRDWDGIDQEEQMWLDLIGYDDFSVPANRCKYNAESALWASRNWATEINFRTGPEPEHIRDARSVSDWMAGELSTRGKTHNNHLVNRTPGDMLTCNTCSLQLSCKLYRKDEICSVPNSDVGPLAKHFESRDPLIIQKGLAGLIERQMNRAERGVALEERRLKVMDEDPDAIPMMDPEVTKIIDSAMKAGLQLVKINQPKTPLVNIGNINTGPEAASLSTQTSMADAVELLEKAGWSRDAIDETVLERVMRGSEVPPPPAALPPQVEDAHVVLSEENEGDAP